MAQTPLIKRGAKPISRVYGTVHTPEEAPNYDDLVYRPRDSSGANSFLSYLNQDPLPARATPPVPLLSQGQDPMQSWGYQSTTDDMTNGAPGDQSENAALPYGIPLPAHRGERSDYSQVNTPVPTPPNIGPAPQYDPSDARHRAAGIMKYAQFLPLLSLFGGHPSDATAIANPLFRGIQEGAEQGAEHDFNIKNQNYQQDAAQKEQAYQNQVRGYSAESQAADRVNDSIDKQNSTVRLGNADADRAYDRAVTNARIASDNKAAREQKQSIEQQRSDDKKASDRLKLVRTEINSAIALTKNGRLSPDAEEKIANFLSDPENKNLVLGTDFLNEFSPKDKAEIARWTLDRKSREKISLEHDKTRIDVADRNASAAMARLNARNAHADNQAAQGLNGDKFAMGMYRQKNAELKSQDVAINSKAVQVAQKLRDARKLALDPKNQDRPGVMSKFAKGAYDAYVREADALEREIEQHKQKREVISQQLQSIVSSHSSMQYGPSNAQPNPAAMQPPPGYPAAPGVGALGNVAPAQVTLPGGTQTRYNPIAPPPPSLMSGSGALTPSLAGGNSQIIFGGGGTFHAPAPAHKAAKPVTRKPSVAKATAKPAAKKSPPGVDVVGVRKKK